MANETMTKIKSITAAGGESYIEFLNIPQYYTDLKVVVSARSARTNDAGGSDGKLEFNGITTGYSAKILTAQGAAYSNSVTTLFFFSDSNNSTSNAFGNTEFYIPNYSTSSYKAVSIDYVSETNASTAYSGLTAGLWSNNSPITSLRFTDNNGGFLANSTFTLYGIKNMANTIGNSLKAFGGNIAFDGTYVYHTFTSTGTFIPTRVLTADVLVVSGGGGGSQNFGGGGGAGGVTTLTSQALSVTTYPVTIGAGAAAGTSSTTYSAAGSTSTFNGTTPSGGGGSRGGGAGGSYLPNGGASGNGYAAGAAGSYTDNAHLQGGSGGGAGAAGSAASATSPGARGGDGATGALINAMCFATGSGQNVSGTYYISGGGGGGGVSRTNGNGGWGPGYYYAPCAGGYGGGGYGGSGDTGYINGVAGLTNTGSGGGGGCWDNSNGGNLGYGGNGGSGVVIIRYKA